MNDFKFAIKQTFPIFFAYIFLGIAFGIMMSEAGYSVLTSALSSLFIYAGSAQIVMVPLLQAKASLITLAIMTFFINARHIFYGLGFIERFRKMGWKYPYMVLSLTDETYSILCSLEYPDDVNQQKVDFYISSINQLYWILGSILGNCAGSFLPFDLKGIEFSATAFFLIVVINQLQQYRTKIPVLTGLASAIIFYIILGPDYFIIPSLSVTLLTLIILRDIVSRKLEPKNER